MNLFLKFEGSKKKLIKNIKFLHESLGLQTVDYILGMYMYNIGIDLCFTAVNSCKTVLELTF